jgi:hypothetical protein
MIVDWLPDIAESENDNVDYEAEEPKQPSYFYVTEESIKVLLGCRATAEQICAFIIAAKSRHTMSNNLTAGYNVISKCLGIRPQKAKRIYMELPTLTFKNRQLVRLLTINRTRRTANLKDSGSLGSAIYFPSDFVGHKSATEQYPIRELCSTGDVAVRLYLYIKGKTNADLDGCLMSEESEACNFLTVRNGIMLGYVKVPEFRVPSVARYHLEDVDPKSNDIRKWTVERQEALDKLLSLKLVESVVVAKVYTDDKRPTECCYDIHVQGEPKKGSIRDRIRMVAVDEGVSHGRKDGKSHDGIYHVIAPEGYTVRLCRVLRSVHKHIPVFDSVTTFANMKRSDSKRALQNWLNVLDGTSSIDTITLPHCNPLAHTPDDQGPSPFMLDGMNSGRVFDVPKCEEPHLLSEEEVGRLIEEGNAFIYEEQQRNHAMPRSNPVKYVPPNDTDDDFEGY